MCIKNLGTAFSSLLVFLLMGACSGTPAPVKFDAGAKKDTKGASRDIGVIDERTDGFSSTDVPVNEDVQQAWDSRQTQDVEQVGDVGQVGDAACPMVAPLVITTTSPLPPAQVGKSYKNTLEIKGGLEPFRFELTTQKFLTDLAWLSLNAENGTLSGLSTEAQGPLIFEVQVTDSGPGTCRMIATKSLEIRVSQCAENEVLECFTALKDGVCAKGSALCITGVPGSCANPISLSTDPAHCGAECMACPSNSDRCFGGLCQCGTGKPCGNGQTCCAGKCFDAQTNADNCGGCGKKCLAGQNAKAVCIGGECASETMCLSGYGNCDPKRPKDCPTNLNTDFNHCGTCDDTCPAQRSSSCEDGKCICGDDKFICGVAPEACCPAGQGLKASCADLSKGQVTGAGIARCGTCDTLCPKPKGHGSAVCATKRCSSECEEGWQDCGNGSKTKVTPPRDCSVDIYNDVKNCGGCGIVCPQPTSRGNAICENGKCGIECDDGRTQCPGTGGAILCVATATDSMNCGECGVRCSKTNASGSSCIDSHCIPTCLPGYGDCKTNKNDGCETALNTTTQCGTCSQVCSSSHIAPFCSIVPGEEFDADADPCGGGTCSANYGDCNQNKRTDGCETELSTIENCGACGVACAAQPGQEASCVESSPDQYQCAVHCAPGFWDCNGDQSCETSSCVSPDCDDNPCNDCVACGVPEL